MVRPDPPQTGIISDGILLAEDGAANTEGVLMIAMPMIDLIQVGLLIAILVVMTRR